MDHEVALGHVVGLPGRHVFAVRRGIGQQPEQLGLEPLGLGRRRDPELGLEQVAAAAILLERGAHPVLVHVEADQRALHAFLQGIEREEAQGDLDRAIDGAGDHTVVEKALQGLVQGLFQPAPLREQPLLERRAAVGEPFKEGAAI